MNDELMTEFFELCRMKDISNMEAYAQHFYILARRFDATDRPAMAAACHGRWQQYMQMGSGHYIRVMDRNFAELTEVR